MTASQLPASPQVAPPPAESVQITQPAAKEPSRLTPLPHSVHAVTSSIPPKKRSGRRKAWMVAMGGATVFTFALSFVVSRMLVRKNVREELPAATQAVAKPAAPPPAEALIDEPPADEPVAAETIEEPEDIVGESLDSLPRAEEKKGKRRAAPRAAASDPELAARLEKFKQEAAERRAVGEAPAPETAKPTSAAPETAKPTSADKAAGKALAPKGECAEPTYMDPDGIRRIKPQCL